MKNFTNKGFIQKILIAIIIVVLMNFSIPIPVQADVGGKLMSPVITFLTSILDGCQHMLEWTMLGETADYMKSINSSAINRDNLPNKKIQVEQKLDGSFFGLDAINIPVITYTPEAIFANQVPGLDINFINPSVKTGNDEQDQKMNIAMKLRPTIASWYTAIRAVAIVALMSVLVYLGIRILLTGIAADKAKYKKMLMDWVVAMCLLFVMHYIMSFALTMSETVTALIASEPNSTFTVELTKNTNISNFGTNLMSYVRLMIQCVNLSDKLAFFFLYLMLVIYNFRFTWVYLKRVVNMAFLTLMAPLVSVTYPIDKVGDSKAQAFDMWIKEFTFNALIQPLHLILYIVLLGSATELAVYNPLYAIVCLGFIIAGEKLLKQMFGFNKAPGGTLGSLAGAAGVSTLAARGVGMFAKGGKDKGGGNGKIRTDDKMERKGKDKGANKDLDSFNREDSLGIEDPFGIENNNSNNNSDDNSNNTVQNATDEAIDMATNTLDANNQQQQQEEQQQQQQQTLEELEQQRAELYNQGYTDDNEEIKEINDKIQNGEFIDPPKEPNNSGSPIPNETTQSIKNTKNQADAIDKKQERRAKLKAIVKRNIAGIVAGGKALAYSAARGTLKAVPKLALGIGSGAIAGAIGATLGDGEKSMAMAGTAFAGGMALGGKVFEQTAGQVIPEKNVQREVDRAKYGSVREAQNKRADKAYFRNGSFEDYFDDNFKGKKKIDGSQYTQEEIREAVQSYREAGITDEKTIKQGILLEDKYKQKDYKDKFKLSDEKIRGEVQNIAQTKGLIETRAFYDKEAKQKELERIEASLTYVPEKNRKAVARRVFKGYEDFRSIT